MMITLTEQATQKLKKNLDKQPESTVVKIGIKKSGCTGYAYVMEYVEIDETQSLTKHELGGIDIYIDPKHNVFLEGMTVDFQKKGLNEMFEFINPNESARCGCGESFTI